MPFTRLSAAPVLAAAALAAACQPAWEDTPGTDAERGGGRFAGEDSMDSAARATAERFGLENETVILLPGAFRGAVDTSDGAAVNATPQQGDPDFVRVRLLGDPDPGAVLETPRRALVFEIGQDRINRLAGNTVNVTLIARTPDPFGEGERPAFNAAWVTPSGETSGWRSMALTEDWQKAVFAYDVPQGASGEHLIAVLPPEGRDMDIAAVGLRAID